MQLIAQHVKLSLAESHIASCYGSDSSSREAVFRAWYGDWRSRLLGSLSLVRWVVRTKLWVVSVSTRLTRSGEVASKYRRQNSFHAYVLYSAR
jgi:hypothetical protein